MIDTDLLQQVFSLVIGILVVPKLQTYKVLCLLVVHYPVPLDDLGLGWNDVAVLAEEADPRLRHRGIHRELPLDSIVGMQALY